ncbi:MAG: PAS domain-containing protein [Bacteroidales bacterium]|nr:PAS domain-containing protein [Bacteroidales bacterium]
MEQWANGLEQVAITVTDDKGIFIDMNTHSKRVNLKDVNKTVVGKDIKHCHNERSNQIIQKIIETKTPNVYTISKNGQKKLIYQAPWFKEDGSFGGLTELSLVIPEQMPHYVRQ